MIGGDLAGVSAGGRPKLPATTRSATGAEQTEVISAMNDGRAGTLTHAGDLGSERLPRGRTRGGG